MWAILSGHTLIYDQQGGKTRITRRSSPSLCYSWQWSANWAAEIWFQTNLIHCSSWGAKQPAKLQNKNTCKYFFVNTPTKNLRKKCLFLAYFLAFTHCGFGWLTQMGSKYIYWHPVFWLFWSREGCEVASAGGCCAVVAAPGWGPGPWRPWWMMLALHCPASTHTSLPPFLHYLGSGQRSAAPAKGVKEILSKSGHLSKKPELTGSLIFLQPIN